MLSRVADSIFWLNRYIERAENVARFLEVNLNLILDLPTRVQQQWQPLVATTGDKDFFEQHYGEANAENVIKFLTFDHEYPNSLISCLQKARENARSVREVISTEMWQHVNAFYLLVANTADDLALADLNQFLEEVRQASHLFAGIMDATISHNEGWHFGQMGRLLERADKTSRILDVKYFMLLPSLQHMGTPIDELGWIALLKSTSAYEMYRKRSNRHLITPAEVADFLILDPDFPRSIRFCAVQVERSLHLVSGSPLGSWCNPAERSIGRLRSELEFLTVEEIIEGGMHQFLDRLQQQMNQVDQEIFKTFLDRRPVHTHLQIQSQS
ncbi:alpha-E domain-containing protein [Acaryochloris sp. 'Moss Beach']|uniref:alpha-E domain-containing protein n=1 Tax=Acaryochloris sp. 'Moss Beach' TaxID=2740837 RepID=UPI001F2B5F99|nr:alpha-E domain-containing protein [Acaryochloris sp. 'Moss Beach']UJB70497.1 alpha-E domain-containing protein [Acaryochloris sp. 'Moss Beach']